MAGNLVHLSCMLKLTGSLRNKLWANEVSWGYNCKWVRGDILICISTPSWVQLGEYHVSHHIVQMYHSKMQGVTSASNDLVIFNDNFITYAKTPVTSRLGDTPDLHITFSYHLVLRAVEVVHYAKSSLRFNSERIISRIDLTIFIY